MASISSDEENVISNCLKENNKNRNIRQAQSSQNDLFDESDSDSTDSNSESEVEGEEEECSLINPPLTNKLQVLPAVAVPEKIVFCIDTTLEIVGGFSLEDSQQSPSVPSIRNEAIRVFVTNKLSIARDTEFALVSLAPGKADLVSSLSSNVDQLMSGLSDLKTISLSKTRDYDIIPMFKAASNIIDIPNKTKPSAMPPSFILRLILIYGNSSLEPTVNTNNDFYKTFISSPICMLDIIYLHDKATENNNVKKIFNCLVKIAQEHSYVLENASNVTTMFNKMSKLLAHPCQRVPQELWNY